MAISDLIVHRIIRSNPTDPAKSITRSEALQLNGRVEETMREMKLGFVKKLTKIHGQFSGDSGDYPLSQWLSEYLNEKMSLASFSKNAMKHFEQCLSASETLVDAYVVFVKEKLQHAEDFYVFIVQHKQGLYLDGDLNIDDCQYLDTDNITLAAKVNLLEWQGDDSNLSYLSLLVSRGEKELNEAFLQWIGFTNKANIKEQTDAFIEVIEEYVKHQPEPVAFETREKAVDYCIEQDKAGRRVDIAELSEQLVIESSEATESQNKQAFTEFVKEKQPKLQSEIIPDRSRLRNYVRISGRDELVSMSFDSKCLGQSIIYDANSDSLTITNIPKGLKSRLKRHMTDKILGSTEKQ